MFVDNSLGSTPMTWEWDFGDGTTSSRAEPGPHVSPARDVYGLPDREEHVRHQHGNQEELYHHRHGAKSRFFRQAPLTGDAPLTVKFTDQSLGQVTKWNWDFGDGKGSSEQSPVHTYWSGGDYNVILTVSNEYGSSDITKTHYIRVIGDLKSVFSADPASGKAPLTVKFTDRSIGTPATWSWDFGDGTNSTLTEPGPHVHRNRHL